MLSTNMYLRPGEFFLFAFDSAVQPDNAFVKDFKDLLATHPEVDVNAMGFPAAWQNEPLWK
ncbi:MAG: hypothetical protein IKN31_00250 [Bacteroidales bacterium]|nr:hypothetical protein [Bacteroidales bacterium]